ncbi:protein shisa-4 isoform X2 [Prinia subflava]|uniref:protein shisa-4 isoform X2 n=1 Tax=Prinia subflava TaxID=208062 RepID=UPI002FE1638D
MEPVANRAGMPSPGEFEGFPCTNPARNCASVSPLVPELPLSHFGCPGVKTACGTWTKTGHGILASTVSSSPSVVARASSGTAAETLCAYSPSASSAIASPSGPEIPLSSYPPAVPPAPFPVDPKVGPMPPQPGFTPMAMYPPPGPAAQYPTYPSGPPVYNATAPPPYVPAQPSYPGA